MKCSVRKRGTILTFAACLLMATGAGPAALGGTPALQVAGVSVNGNTLEVQVVNTGDQALTGTVTARVLLGGEEVSALAVIQVPGKGRIHVDLVFPASETPIIPLGVILDDGPPL